MLTLLVFRNYRAAVSSNGYAVAPIQIVDLTICVRECVVNNETAESPNVERAPSDAIRVLRWIVLFPAAVLSYVLGRYVAVLFAKVISVIFIASASNYIGDSSEASEWWLNFMGRCTELYIGGALVGAIFVGVSSAIAPNHKQAVAIGAAVIVVVFCGVLLFPVLLSGSYSVIFEILCVGFGAVATAHTIFNDKQRR